MPAPFALAILGARFPHLALGALLAKRGRRVLVVDPSPPLPARGGVDARTFRRRPAPLFGLDAGGLLRRVLDEVGVGQVLVRKAYPANAVSYQVVLPRHRIDVRPSREALLSEFSRELPEGVDRLRALYRTLDAVAEMWFSGTSDLAALQRRRPTLARLRADLRGWRTTRHAGNPLASFRDAEGEGAFVAIQNHFLGAHAPDAAPSLLSAALVHSVARRGTFQETLGTASLTDLMLTRFQEYGGEVRKGAEVSLTERRGGATLIGLGGAERLEAQCVAASEELAVSVKGFPPGRPARVAESPSLVPLRVYVGIEGRYVPVGMADDLFLVREAGGGPLGVRLLYLALSPAGPPEAVRGLTATALVPAAEAGSLSEEQVQAFTSDVLEALESVIPFLPEGLRHASCDGPPGVRAVLPRPMGGGFTAWDPLLVGAARVGIRRGGRFLVLSPAPWELGLEGEALTALYAAGAVGRLLGKG